MSPTLNRTAVQNPPDIFIESVDSICRDERDAPLTQLALQTLEYLTLGTLSCILYTTIVFYG